MAQTLARGSGSCIYASVCISPFQAMHNYASVTDGQATFSQAMLTIFDTAVHDHTRQIFISLFNVSSDWIEKERTRCLRRWHAGEESATCRTAEAYFEHSPWQLLDTTTQSADGSKQQTRTHIVRRFRLSFAFAAFAGDSGGGCIADAPGESCLAAIGVACCACSPPSSIRCASIDHLRLPAAVQEEGPGHNRNREIKFRASPRSVCRRSRCQTRTSRDSRSLEARPLRHRAVRPASKPPARTCCRRYRPSMHRPSARRTTMTTSRGLVEGPCLWTRSPWASSGPWSTPSQSPRCVFRRSA